LQYAGAPWLALCIEEKDKPMRCAVLAILVGLATPAAAQPADVVATGSLLAGCQSLVENAPSGNMMQMGACAGAVSAALDISRALRQSCPPGEVGVIDVARRIVMFVDERPARQADQFGPLVLTALRDRWPC
jgi:hypothetical protein